MQNGRSVDGVRSAGFDSYALNQSPAYASQAAEASAGPLTMVAPRPTVMERLGAWRIIIVIVAVVSLLLGGVFVVMQRANRATRLGVGDFEPTSIPLAGLENSDLVVAPAKSLKVNGVLQVSNSLVLSPTSQPVNAVAGQLYFDQTTNQLAYYNGQQFVGVGAAGTNVTNTLVTGSNAGNVRLQTTSPGVQQAGNINISGTAIVGALSTTVIDTGGTTLYVSPVGATAQQTIAPGTPATVGTTEVGPNSTAPGDISGNHLARKITMGSVGGTAKSISVYLEGGSAANHVQVGLYADDGNIPSRPEARLAFSSIVNLVPNDWNTITVSDTLLEANTSYWITFNTDDSTVARRYFNNGSETCFWVSGFANMSNPFSPFGPCFLGVDTNSIYLNYVVGSGVSGSLSQALFALGPTGQAIFRNATNATNAFQVQDAAATTTVFNVDTQNGRIGIGKTNPSFRLDIAAGDINLNTGRSLRFGGVQAVSVNGAGTNTILSNFATGGSVTAQAGKFVVQSAADATVAFTVDVTNSRIRIGSSTGSANPVILVLANKNTAGDPAGEEGGVYYNSTLASFRCFYSGFWQNCADIEPQHGFSFYDDFVGGQTSFTGQIGSLGWNAAAIGANGSLTLNPSTPTPSADRPGVLQLQTPAVSNQGTTLLLGNTGGALMRVAKDNDMKVAVAVGAATNQAMRVGLHDQTGTTTQPISGVWWEADPAANANWRYCYGNGTTATCANSSVAIAANTWVTLEIRVTATGSGTSAATFVINNAASTVSSTTIDSTNRVSPALSCYATTGAAQNCYWDYFQLTGTTAAAR
jgi:hypothetical protein